MLPLLWVLSELKTENMRKWIMAEDITLFLLSSGPHFSVLIPILSFTLPLLLFLFLSLYAVSPFLLLFFFLSLLHDNLKVAFETHITPTLMYKCSKGTLSYRRHWWNFIDSEYISA